MCSIRTERKGRTTALYKPTAVTVLDCFLLNGEREAFVLSATKKIIGRNMCHAVKRQKKNSYKALKKHESTEHNNSNTLAMPKNK